MRREISESGESIETQDSIENSIIKTPSKSDSGKYFKSKTERRRRGDRLRKSNDSLNNSNDSKYLSPISRESKRLSESLNDLGPSFSNLKAISGPMT